MHTFSEKRHAALFSLCSHCGFCNEIAEEFQESNWVRQIIDHEGREGVSSIQRDVSTPLNRRHHIQAMCLQSGEKAVSVRLSRDHNRRTPGLEGCSNELSEGVQKTCIIRIEPRLVAAGDLYILSLQKYYILIATRGWGALSIRTPGEIVSCESASDEPFTPKNSFHSDR